MLLPAGETGLRGQSIVAYVEGPGVQVTSVTSTSGVTTENFNWLSGGTYTSPVATAIGTYEGSSTSKFAIVSANQYGGAGGTGKYFAVGAESGSSAPVQLNLYAEANYFGFWWSAGDRNNSITFLQDGTALATFTTATLVALLPKTAGATVTAINGTTYSTTGYYGNPNNAQDSNEPFAYVDVIATGLQFNQIQFANTISTGFESDNHSVAAGVTGPGDGDVVVQNVELITPEPIPFTMMALGLVLIGGSRLRRHRAE